MTYLLDTSAIIGWLERADSSVAELLAGADSALYHPVTVGELHAGIERATSAAELEMRTNTLRFTLARLQSIPAAAALPGAQFGYLTARLSRRLSHNDYWLVASAMALGVTLATEDVALFEAVTSEGLASGLRSRAWVDPEGVLVRSTPLPT